ncbi:MAG: thiamine biosynthesis protein ThiS [Salinisphaeraceae bacterium]|jgi:sulfur carrier protein|nr:thiamine biosynthesis protein ThiS [Salinisphaeraceae bacterium]
MAFRLHINGEEQSFDRSLSVLDLVERLGLHKRRLAIELNGDILPRAEYAQTTLADGDRLEIVHAIGGG